MISRTILRSRHPRMRPRFSRQTSTNHSENELLQPVKYLSPVLWSTAAISTIYCIAAYWEVRQDISRETAFRANNPKMLLLPHSSLSPESSERLRIFAANEEGEIRASAKISIADLTSIEALREAWRTRTSPEKASWTAIGICTAVYLPSKMIPAIQYATFHIPAANRNWTLLTSTFGHGGPFHLLLNMYILNNFTLPVSRSKTFKGSAAHCSAFYLSAGILSSLANHLQSAFKPMYRTIPCLGASGAIYGLLGVFTMSFPDSRVGIILLPFSFPAQQALIGLAAFELYGTIIGTRLGLAHAAHLGGLAAGVAYVYFDAGVNIWGRLKTSIYRATERAMGRQEKTS